MKDYTSFEKKALIAILKFLASSDGNLSDNELNQFDKLAEEKGFEDFRDVFAQVDAEVTSLKELSSMVNGVVDKEKQKEILTYAKDMAGADGVNANEADVLNYLGRVWDLD